MHCLVTGSHGFIGKRLVKALAKKGFFVKEFDYTQNKSVLNPDQLEQEIKGADIVFHLAAVLDEQGENLFEVNVQGTKNVLEASARQHVKQVIFTSTVGVMGDIQKKADENTSLNPKTPYEKSKAEAEKTVLSYQETVPVTIVRPALVLGPNKEWKQIIKTVEKNFPLIGNGEKNWQIIYVDDLVDALVFLAEKEEALGETFIIAENSPKTLRTIVEFIRKKKGVTKELKTIPQWLAKAAAAVYSPIASLFGKKTFFTPEIIDRTIRLRDYSSEKINKLGWYAKYDTFEALEKTILELQKQEQ